MDLEQYFSSRNGIGVLASADEEGKVNGAIYSKPHIINDDTVAFIMRDRLTHHNSLRNPFASYLFIENGTSSQGVRLYLKKTGEETDSEKISNLSRRKRSEAEEKELGDKYLVYYTIEKILPLVGTDLGKIDI